MSVYSTLQLSIQVFKNRSQSQDVKETSKDKYDLYTTHTFIRQDKSIFIWMEFLDVYHPTRYF